MTRRRQQQVTADEAGQAYAVYWSIYTDLRGRNHFRDLYWDKLKDLIGRPAKLVGIEREDLWPSGKPSAELRCHVWNFFEAETSAEAIVEVVRAAMRVAPGWRILTFRPEADDEVFEMIWDRPRAGASDLPLPRLTSILVSIHHDTGFRIEPGGRSASNVKRTSRKLVAVRRMGTLQAEWEFQVQTSTKRELLETHWPLLQRRFAGTTTEMFDLAKRSGDIGPFYFKVRQVVSGATEAEAVGYLLQQSYRMLLSLDHDKSGGFVMRGRSDAPDSTNAHWLRAFEARFVAD